MLFCINLNKLSTRPDEFWYKYTSTRWTQNLHRLWMPKDSHHSYWSLRRNQAPMKHSPYEYWPTKGKNKEETGITRIIKSDPEQYKKLTGASLYMSFVETLKSQNSVSIHQQPWYTKPSSPNPHLSKAAVTVRLKFYYQQCQLAMQEQTTEKAYWESTHWCNQENHVELW